MAALGDIGFAFPTGAPTYAYSVFGLNKNGAAIVRVDIAGTGVNITTTPFAFLNIIRNAVYNDRTRADGSGNWHFYDLDDSGSQIYTITAYTQDGPTGEMWSSTVTGSVAVVTKLFASQRALAAAFA